MSALSILVIDSGNTFVKWGLHDGDHWITKNKIHHSQLKALEDDFRNLPEPNMVVISHVSGEIIRDQLTILMSRWSVKPTWILAQSCQCEVTNGYSISSQLGSDRWAALVAARKFQKEGCLVVNVGTAMTVDALSPSGHFLGGLVMPGFYAMMNGLKADTGLQLSETLGKFHDFPKNTNDGVYSGLIQSLLGAIERMYSTFLKQNPMIGNCIMSGGGAYQLMPFIKFPVVYIENLVLEGLVIIAKDLTQKKKHLL